MRCGHDLKMGHLRLPGRRRGVKGNNKRGRWGEKATKGPKVQRFLLPGCRVPPRNAMCMRTKGRTCLTRLVECVGTEDKAGEHFTSWRGGGDSGETESLSRTNVFVRPYTAYQAAPSSIVPVYGYNGRRGNGYIFPRRAFFCTKNHLLGYFGVNLPRQE